MDFSIINENSFWAVPLVVAITEVFKMSGFNHKFAPMISLVIGIGMSFLINMELGMSQILISGIIYGLSASGLYSSVKTTSNIRGVVPLREKREPVVVEQIEIEKPLNSETISATEQVQVSESLQSNAKPQNQQKQQSQAQTTSTPQQEKPIFEKPVENIGHVDEINVEVNEQDKK